MIKITDQVKKLLKMVLILHLFLTSAQIFCESKGTESNYIILDISTPWIWGGSLELGYGMHGLLGDTDTVIWTMFNGDYGDSAFFRNSDGSVYMPETEKEMERTVYERVDLTWVAGIRQGLLYDNDEQENALEVFLYYKGTYFNNLQGESPADSLIFESGLPDNSGLLQNSLLLGISYVGIKTNIYHQTKKGINCFLSMDVANKFLFNDIGDYDRLTAVWMGALPVIDDDLISIYISERLIYDHLFGSYIPIHARTSFGGLFFDLLPGMGGAMRDIDDNKYDGYIKMINNFDIRILFPSIFGRYFIPGLVFYSDIGLTDNLTNNIDFNNTLFSFGGGIFLYVGILDMIGFDPLIIDNMNIIVCCGYLANEIRINVSFNLDFHF